MASHLVFYSDIFELDQCGIIRELFNIFNADKARDVIKSRGVSREWEAWNTGETLVALTPNLSRIDDSEILAIEGELSVDELVQLFSVYEKEYISFSLFPYERSDQIALSLNHNIPDSIRDDFDPRSVEFSVGPHDIFETSDPDNPTYIARASFSMDFCDNADTYSPDKYLELALLDKELRKLISEVEVFSGPLKSCIYWGHH